MWSPFSLLYCRAVIVAPAILLCYLLICWTTFDNYLQLAINVQVVAIHRLFAGVDILIIVATSDCVPSSPGGSTSDKVIREPCLDFIVIECEKSVLYSAVRDGGKNNLITSKPSLSSGVEQKNRKRQIPASSTSSSSSWPAPPLHSKLALHIALALLQLLFLVVLKTVSVLVKTVMLDPLKILWVLTNSTYLGNVP